MFSSIELQRDEAGTLNGTLFAENGSALVRIRITRRHSLRENAFVYSAFLGSSFIGEYESDNEAIDSTLFHANVRYAAGNM